MSPPADPMPAAIFFRGAFDRTRGRAEVESLDATFLDSHLHLTGAVDKIPGSPELDLVLAVERSHVEDFAALARRFATTSRPANLTGRIDALVTIQGPWNDRRYSGFVSGRGWLLNTPSGNFPVSNVDLRLENREARLAPVQILMAPHVALELEGSISPPAPARTPRRAGRFAPPVTTAGPLRYEITATAKSVPLHEVVSFGRALGFYSAPGVDARGAASGELTLSGAVWPPERPTLDGTADLQGASLLVPGFTEPLNLPRARIQVTAGHIVADPMVAVLGTTVFSGRIEHQGDRGQPWRFDLHANALSLEQSSLWFDVMGRRQPIALLERLPGLGSSRELRAAASGLFGALNLEGKFSSPLVTYHAVALTDFQCEAEISGRVIRLKSATFKAGGGRGEGKLAIDLTKAPARVTIDAALSDANLQMLAPRLPAQLRKLRGTCTASAHLETRGLSHEESTSNLQGNATLQLKNVSLGDLDPLQAVAREKGWGNLERNRGEVAVRSAVASLEIHDNRVVLGNLPLDIAGAKLKLTGTWTFEGALALEVAADLNHLSRRWIDPRDAGSHGARTTELHLEGAFGHLAVVPEVATTKVNP